MDARAVVPADTTQVSKRVMALTGSQRVWVMTILTALLGVVVYALTSHGAMAPVTSIDVPWFAILVLFYIVEVFVVHLQFKRYAYSFSLSEVPLILGLFFIGPAGTILAHMIGAGVALVLNRRQSALKATFNVVTLGLEAAIACAVFYTLIPAHEPVGPAGWGSAFLAMAAWGITQYVLIGFAISLMEGRLQLNTMLQGIGLGMTVTATNTCIALVGVTLLARDPLAGWLLFVPMATMYFAYRAYTSERQKHESIESLYEASRSAHRSLKVEEAMRNLLSQCLEMFQAEKAMITLFPNEEGEVFRRTILDLNADFTYMAALELDPTEGVWARVAAEDHAVLVSKPIANPRIKQFYEEQGIYDAIVAPLHAENDVIGIMHVCNRLGEVATFHDEDAKLLETLANHASVSLENARLVARLQESLAHLTEMNRLKDDFVASVSHELRTPLTSIRGYVKTLLRPDAHFSASDQHDFLETIDRQSQRLHRLIEDLLAVSRIESETDQTVLSMVVIPQLMNDISDELRTRTGNHEIRLDLDRTLPVLQTDSGKVHQVLLNLIDNALKYSPKDTAITVKAWQDGAGVTVEVRDQGPGIPSEQQEAIFDRFYQVDQSATRRVGGAGLGLYICRRMAEAIGGRVWLERSDDSGSSFALWVPETPPFQKIVVERADFPG